MTQVFAIALVGALAICGVQTWRITGLSDRLEATERTAGAYAEAIDTDLQTMEGGVAPLGDYLSAAAGRLWPQ